MKRKTLLTTGEVAAHCEVSVKTVNNWINSGHLKAATTPGRHHRVRVDVFNAFLREHDLPLYEGEHVERCRILIADDEEDVVQVLVKSFRKTDQYEVATAFDGFEAGLQVAKFEPDLVILDLIMPNLDGFKVCQLIKSNPDTKHIKVLVLTGYASDENRQKALDCGADGFMTKPLKIAELQERVEELLILTGMNRTPLAEGLL